MIEAQSLFEVSINDDPARDFEKGMPKFLGVRPFIEADLMLLRIRNEIIGKSDLNNVQEIDIVKKVSESLKEIFELLNKYPDMAKNWPEYERVFGLSILEWFPYYQEEKEKITYEESIHGLFSKYGEVWEGYELYSNIALGHKVALKSIYNGYGRSYEETLREEPEHKKLLNILERDEDNYLTMYLDFERNCINKIHKARSKQNNIQEYNEALKEVEKYINEELKANYYQAPIGIILRMKKDIDQLLNDRDKSPFKRELGDMKIVEFI